MKKILSALLLVSASLLFSQKPNADTIWVSLNKVAKLEQKIKLLNRFYRDYGQIISIPLQQKITKTEMDWSLTTQNPRNIMEAWGDYERMYTTRAISDSVKYCLNQRYALAKQLKDSSNIINCELQKARLLILVQDYTNALPILNRCYDLALKIKDTSNFISANSRFGLFYRSQKNYDNAQKYAKLAWEMGQKMLVQTPENQRNVAGYALNLGDCYYEKHQWDSAIIFYEKGLKTWKKLGNPLTLGMYYNTLGKAYGQQKKIKEATYYLEKSIHLTDSLEHFTLANLMLGFAEFLYNNGESKQALEYCEKTKKILDREDYVIADMQWLNVTLSHIYEDLGDYKKALYYEHLQNKMMDTIRENHNKEALDALQTQYEVNRKNDQILHLDESVKQRTQQRNNAMLGAALLFIAVAVAIWSYLQKRKAHQLLQSQNEQILQQKNQLQSLNHTKDRLFSILSHDLRSPLSYLHNVLQALHSEIDSSHKSFSLLKSAESKLNSTLLVMDNLLSWSSGQFKGIKPKATPFYVIDSFSEALFLVKEMADNKQISIENMLSEDLMAYADPNMLSTVFRNLLSNAIKFTSKNGFIRVSGDIQETDSMLILQIQDTGKGIPLALQADLLAGKAGSQDGTEGEKGTGLGLNLCKSFIVANGGNIWFESEEGKGTTFFISIPAA